jgi:Zn-finger nucleic acid-binding protein
MHVRSLSGGALHECRSCGGVFLAHGTIEHIIEDRGGSLLAIELLASMPRARTSTSPPPGQRMYVKCPTCDTLMNRRLFATGAGIVIDVCKADGAFFDAGELPAVVEFVMADGLENAARKDASRALEARRAAAQNARSDAQRNRAAGAPSVDGPEAGIALADLFVSLFS